MAILPTYSILHVVIRFETVDKYNNNNIIIILVELIYESPTRSDRYIRLRRTILWFTVKVQERNVQYANPLVWSGQDRL